MVRAPMLTTPELGEDLFMHLSVSEHAVSAVLLRDQGVQQPLYYINKTLVDAEMRYLPLEKLVLALMHATWKLPHYFPMPFGLTNPRLAFHDHSNESLYGTGNSVNGLQANAEPSMDIH